MRTAAEVEHNLGLLDHTPDGGVLEQILKVIEPVKGLSWQSGPISWGQLAEFGLVLDHMKQIDMEDYLELNGSNQEVSKFP
jgi:hypothetical protein